MILLVPVLSHPLRLSICHRLEGHFRHCQRLYGHQQFDSPTGKMLRGTLHAISDIRGKQLEDV